MSEMTNIVLFIAGWALLVAQYGTWQGQYWVGQSAAESRNALFLLVFSCFAFGVVVIRKKRMRLLLPGKKLLIFFFLNLLFAGLIRGDFFSFIRQYVGLTLSFVIALFLSSLLQSVSIKRAILIYVFCIFATLLVSTYVHLTTSGTLTFFTHEFLSRLGGLFFTAHVAILAGLSGLLSLMALSAFNFAHNKIFYMVNILVMPVLILFTDTRSVMVVFFICGFFIYYAGFRKTLLINKIMVLSLVLCAGLFLYYYFYILPPDLNRTESDFGLRTSIWAVSIDGILANPFIGYGSQNFLSGNSAAWSINPTLADSHNSLLDHALRYGLFSLLIFLLYYLVLMLTIIRKSEPVYQGFIFIMLYWLGTSFFWGHVFNISGGFIQIVFWVTVLGISIHPDIFVARQKLKSIK